MEFSPAQCLHTASKSDISVHYCTGAKYQGALKDNKRKGVGYFEWPNGCKYDGEFVDNKREGQGVQSWADGSTYEGVFKADLRHGQGVQSWSDGSKYSGSFCRGRRHNKGLYTWSDGSSYEGNFYIDKRDGYGKYVYSNGDQFEGLYKNDERFGPGILTYTDGRQDIGMWSGDKLIKLLSPVKDAFSMDHHLELGYDPNDHVKYTMLEERYENMRSAINPILHPPKPFTYIDSDAAVKQSGQIFSDSLHTDSAAMDKELFEAALFGEGDNKKSKAVVWNSTATLLDIQAHIHRFRSMESAVSFNPCTFRRGPRSTFNSKPGPLEEASVALISAAADGDTHTLQRLLHSGTVSPDVADCNGFTALQATVMNCERRTLNILLDSGADINKLSDEGMSALAQSLVFYYPRESFKENVAEEEYLIQKSTGTASFLSATSLRLHPSYIFEDELEAEKSQKAEKKPQSGRGRDSGIGSRRAGDSNAADSDGESPALTPLSQDTPEPDAHPLSSLTTPAPAGDSDSHKSPSVISQITEKAATLGVTDNNHGEEVSYPDDADDVSIISSQPFSRASPQRPDDFRSDSTVMNYDISVNDALIDRCATVLSHNEMVTRRDDSATSFERSRLLAKRKAMKQERWETIQLLLKRGANPNACIAPMPALVFTIKAGDMEATKLMLLKGADANLRLPRKKGGLSPLHLAAATPGEEGILITACLLDALCDPDSRAAPDRSYLDPDEEYIKKGLTSEDCCGIAGGRTPLHIVCSRSDDHQNCAMVVRELLENKANPNLLCNGHSPLSLAIISGNDMAITELLKYGTDPSLTLTHGNGNALCVASHTAYEHKRTPEERIALINQLVGSGADVLALIPVGPKKILGTALDYAHHIFNLDRRIAHMPYHALSHIERETYNARRKLLSHMGDVVRVKCMERERLRLETELNEENRSRSPSARFLYTGAGAKPEQGGHVKFQPEKLESLVPTIRETMLGLCTIGPLHRVNCILNETVDLNAMQFVRRPLFKYCYECGRSINVRLVACTRCKEVYFCSKNCKVRAWNTRHKDECVRLQVKKAMSPIAKPSQQDLLSQNKSVMSGRLPHQRIRKNTFVSPEYEQSTKSPSRGNKSAPAKLRGAQGKKVAVKALRDGKSYNMYKRPTDRNLAPHKGMSLSHPSLMRGRLAVHRHNQYGGRISPDLAPYSHLDNYSFN